MEGKVMYFAHGSNLSPRLMVERGAEFYSREGAVLPGFRLEFNFSWKDDGYGNTTIVQDEDSVVYGALYSYDEQGIANMDEAEGEKLRRINVHVKKESGEMIQATTYQGKEEFTKTGLRPSETYLNEMLEGEDILPEGYADYLKTLKKEVTQLN